MSANTPIIPPGSPLRNPRADRNPKLVYALSAVFALHVVLLSGLLIQGCKKEDTSAGLGDLGPRHRAGAGQWRPDPVRIPRRCRCRRRYRVNPGRSVSSSSIRRARSASSWRSSARSFYLFLTRTNLGKALRAAADNPIAAAYVGIDVDRSHRIAFGLGVGITAIAGGLFAMSQSFQPYIGFDFVIVMYAGVVLGGMARSSAPSGAG